MHSFLHWDTDLCLAEWCNWTVVALVIMQKAQEYVRMATQLRWQHCQVQLYQQT